MDQRVHEHEWLTARAAAAKASRRAKACARVIAIGSGAIAVVIPLIEQSRLGLGIAAWVLFIGVMLAFSSRAIVRRRLQGRLDQDLKDRLSQTLGRPLSDAQCADVVHQGGIIVDSVKYAATLVDGALEFDAVELNTKAYRSLPTWWS